MSEYANLREWLLTASLVGLAVWPCMFYFRGRASSVIAAVAIGLTLAPCKWMTLFDPRWNGWVPSARGTSMLLANGMFWGPSKDSLATNDWIAMAITACVTFVLIDYAKRKLRLGKQMSDRHSLPPVY